MRQPPLTCGHPDRPRDLERLVPDRRGMGGHRTPAYATGHGSRFSGQPQTDNRKEAAAS
jgi:hypothetical protein